MGLSQRTWRHVGRALGVLVVYTALALLRYAVVDSQVSYEREQLYAHTAAAGGEAQFDMKSLSLPLHSRTTRALVAAVAGLSGVHGLWVCDVFPNLAYASFILAVHTLCYLITLTMQVYSYRTVDAVIGEPLFRLTICADLLIYGVMCATIVWKEAEAAQRPHGGDGDGSGSGGDGVAVDQDQEEEDHLVYKELEEGLLSAPVCASGEGGSSAFEREVR